MVILLQHPLLQVFHHIRAHQMEVGPQLSMVVQPNQVDGPLRQLRSLLQAKVTKMVKRKWKKKTVPLRRLVLQRALKRLKVTVKNSSAVSLMERVALTNTNLSVQMELFGTKIKKRVTTNIWFIEKTVVSQPQELLCRTLL